MARKVESLGRVRAAQAGSSLAWEPVELLDEISRAIKAGEIKPGRLLVLYTLEDEDDHAKFNWQVAKCSFEGAVYMLNLALRQILGVSTGEYAISDD